MSAESDFDAWLNRDPDRIGTHDDDCYRRHPECAAIFGRHMGERAATERIVAIIERTRGWHAPLDTDANAYLVRCIDQLLLTIGIEGELDNKEGREA